METAIINWLDKISLETAAKAALIAFAIAVLGDFIGRTTMWIVRIRKAVKTDGDIYIIK